VATQRDPNGYLAALDALAFLQSIRSDVADVVFLDPPFNLGKDYGPLASVERADPEIYDLYIRAVLKQCVRILAPGGALFLYHMPAWATRWVDYLAQQLCFRHWIAVSMKNGFVRGDRLYPAHYALLYYTKGAPARFARPKLALRRCPHCSKVLKDYGGYRQIVDEKGINLSDVWDDLSPVRHGTSKLRLLNQLPVEITDRICAIAGAPGCLLVDPFAGTGTSLVSAVSNQMHFLGNDIETRNIRICQQRLGSCSAH
jgi:site-specific DNA-methyltransferase (adenine-specific)